MCQPKKPVYFAVKYMFIFGKLPMHKHLKNIVFFIIFKCWILIMSPKLNLNEKDKSDKDATCQCVLDDITVFDRAKIYLTEK